MKRHSSQLPAFESECEEIDKPFIKLYKHTHYSHSKLSSELFSPKVDPAEKAAQPRRAKSQQVEKSCHIIFCGGRLASFKRSLSQDRAVLHDIIRVKAVHVLLLQKDIRKIVEGLKRLNFFCRRYQQSQQLLVKVFQSQVVETARTCRQLLSEFIDDRRSCKNLQERIEKLRRSVVSKNKDTTFCNESLRQSKNKLELLRQTVERKRVDCKVRQQVVEVNERRLAQKLDTRLMSPFRERTNTESGSIKLHTLNEPKTADIKSSSSCAAVKAKPTTSHHLCSVCSSRSSRDVYSLTSFDSKNLLNTKIFNGIN